MIEQILIALTGLPAIYLSQVEDNRKRYACLFGLASQPFWFYSAYVAEQWGVFILCVFYMLAWSKGLFTYWIKPKFSKSALRDKYLPTQIGEEPTIGCLEEADLISHMKRRRK